MKTDYEIKEFSHWQNAVASILENTQPPSIFLLTGHLGAGKTTFVQYAGRFLHVKEQINSPTFNIYNEYEGVFKTEKIKVYHVDCYRLAKSDAIPELDFFDLTDLPFFAFIEWPRPNQNWDRWGIPLYSISIEPMEIDSRGMPQKRVVHFSNADNNDKDASTI